MKRVFFIFFTLLFGTSVVFAATELAGITNFIDVEPGGWYEKAVLSLQQKEIVQGYPDQTFRPLNNVRRNELAVIIEKALQYLQNPEGTAPWKMYKNKKFFYSIAYPSKWRMRKFFDYLIGFQPPSMKDNNVQWAVIVLQNTDDILQTEINKMGAEFSSTRSVLKQNFDLNGTQALVVTVTTSGDPTFFHKQVFILRNNGYYIITNGGIPNPDFELFWQSFKLLELPAPSDHAEKIPLIPESPPSSWSSSPVAIGQTWL